MRADLIKEPLVFVYQHLAKRYCSIRIQNGLQENTGGIAFHDVHTNIRPQYKVVGKSDRRMCMSCSLSQPLCKL